MRSGTGSCWGCFGALQGQWCSGCPVNRNCLGTGIENTKFAYAMQQNGDPRQKEYSYGGLLVCEGSWVEKRR